MGIRRVPAARLFRRAAVSDWMEIEDPYRDANQGHNIADPQYADAVGGKNRDRHVDSMSE